MWRFLLLLVLPTGVFAQTPAPDPGELANIRQELARFYAEIETLRGQLTAEATASGGVQTTGPSVVRLDQLEQELAGLTGRVEQLSNRINQIAVDGTRRVSDLEFRLVELEGGDVTQLGDTPMLGGEVVATMPSVVPSQPDNSTVALAVSEEADFERAEQALGDGQYANAILGFGQFLADYPGGPLSARAMFHLGEAQEAMSQHKEAARSFLDSFTAEPDGAYSAQALMRVGVSLGVLGKIDNACQTFDEVLIRYPNSEVVGLTQTKRQELGCL